MKKLLVALMILFTTSAHAEEIGKIYMGGMIQQESVKIEAFSDPNVKGVTCYLSTVHVDLSFTDPNNSSIACRQTGPIEIGKIDKSKKGEPIFTEKQSLLFNTLKVVRIYDEARGCLVYTSFTTKLIQNSRKISVSAVCPVGN